MICEDGSRGAVTFTHRSLRDAVITSPDERRGGDEREGGGTGVRDD